MNQTITGRTHVRGGGRIYVGLGISGIALFCLAQQAGWLGVNSGSLLWSLLVLGLGLAILVGGRRHTHGSRHCEAVERKGGQS